jgi:hypothetical protein
MPPPFRGRPKCGTPALCALAVLLRVMTARLDVGDMGVMCRLLVIASLVMFRGFSMMLRSVLVVLRGLAVVLDTLMCAHFSLPAGG